jgi:signal transduction histidine kinase
VISFFDPADGLRGTVFTIVINLIWVGVVVWGVTTEAHPGLDGGHLAAVLLLCVAASGWLIWLASRVRRYEQLRLPAWLMMVLAGGALTAFAPLGLVFVGVAALGAGMTWPAGEAALIAAGGPVTALVSAWGAGTSLLMGAWATTAVLGGLTLGIARRQTVESAAQTAKMQVAEARADAEEARAELLAGRNHLARELHDILAHTLSALSLQLEALDALIDSGPEPSLEVRKQLDGIRRLVREGLDDARGAVLALREDPPPLEDQLAKLTGDRHASLKVEGVPRRLSPDVSLAFYRLVQEALTNVAKHAPGATTEVDLAFTDGLVRIAVRNGPAAHSANGPVNGSIKLSGSGAGYGLQGIRERVLLIGGHVEAGPAADGWRVEAEVPA